MSSAFGAQPQPAVGREIELLWLAGEKVTASAMAPGLNSAWHC